MLNTNRFRRFAAVLAAVVATSWGGAAEPREGPTLLTCADGDVTGDGFVTHHDVALIRQRLGGAGDEDALPPSGWLADWATACTEPVDAALLLRAMANLSEPVLREHVVNLDTALVGEGGVAEFEIIEVHQDRLVLRGPAEGSLPFEEGQSVVGTAGEGFLGRVVAISVSGNEYTVTLEALGLADVIQVASFDGEFVLANEPDKGLAWVPASGKEPGGLAVRLDVQDVHVAEGPGAITLRRGALSITPTLRIEGSVAEGASYLRFEVGGGVTFDSEWEFAFLEQASVDVEVLSLGQIPVNRVIIPVAGIPVVLATNVDFPVGVNVSLPTVTYYPRASASGEMLAGFEVMNGREPRLFGGFEGTGTNNLRNVPTESEFAVGVSVGAMLETKVYGVAGPSVGPAYHAYVGRRAGELVGCENFAGHGIQAVAGISLARVFPDWLSLSRTWPLRTLSESAWPCPAPPDEAPVALPATDVDSAQFTANWSPVQDAGEYLLDVSTAMNFNTFITGYAARPVGNTVSHTVTGLAPDTTYFHRVRAANAAGPGPDSNTVGVTTSPAPPATEVTILLPGDVPLILKRIPAGSFVMGSPSGERSRQSNEGPQTNVTIQRDFFLGKYEVTQAQWMAVMDSNPSAFAGANRPVDSVSWEDAQDFVAGLNAHILASGQGPVFVRLPTEAEWEYAARAGTTTRYSFGDSLIGSTGGDACEDDELRSQHMWYCGNGAPAGQPGHGTKDVGQKTANPFGLHDMHGNVWEWCQDWGTSALPGGSVIDPTGPATGVDRTIRGGSWSGNAGLSRSARRGINGPTVRANFNGFRLAATDEEVDQNDYDLSVCNQWSGATSGGFGITSDTWDMSALPRGTRISIRFYAYSVPDRFVVDYQGSTVLDTGWRGSQSYTEAYPDLYPGGWAGPGDGIQEEFFTKRGANTFRVTVYGPEPGTAWDYELMAVCDE